MSNKYIMFSLDDEAGRTKKLSEVLGNKTCKKIIEFLSETKEASESEIADEIKLPLNTTEYNLKKLIETGFVEKTKNHFWSKRGKKIPTYKISNKHIIISPKSSGIINKFSTAIITLIGAVLISVGVRRALKTVVPVEQVEENLLMAGQKAIADSSTFVNEAAVQSGNASGVFIQSLPVWSWFIAGAVFALAIVLILNWKKL